MNERLGSSLDDFEAGRIDMDALIAIWRRLGVEDANLPAKWREVLDGLLMRLESARLFSQDSCSFSRSELLATMREWLARAQVQVQAQQ
ncbi:MAG: hypothetical protein ABIF28_06090 [Pseudomonadota bacterium]